MIAQFALRLVCGMSLMWTIMPRREVTSGFFRIQMLVVLGLSVLASLTMGQYSSGSDVSISVTTGSILCGLIGVLAFLGSVFWTLERRKAGSLTTLLIAVISGIVLILVTCDLERVATYQGVLKVLSELASAATLGGAVVGMLLGHWYLTTPTMSIKPLSQVNSYFGIAVTFRFVCSAVGLLVLLNAANGSGDIMAKSVHSTVWTWLSLRWLAGILGPLLVVVMVWRILRYRNTQAATGVLFVGVILTFIGEMTAALLFEEVQRPL
jgi:hypothetical protein